MSNRIRMDRISITETYNGIPAQLYEVSFHNGPIFDAYDAGTPFSSLLDELWGFALQKVEESNSVGGTLLSVGYIERKCQLGFEDGDPSITLPVVQIWARTDGVKSAY